MITIEKITPVFGSPYYNVSKDGVCVQCFAFNETFWPESDALEQAKKLAIELKDGKKELREQINF